MGISTIPGTEDKIGGESSIRIAETYTFPNQEPPPREETIDEKYAKVKSGDEWATVTWREETSRWLRKFQDDKRESVQKLARKALRPAGWRGGRNAEDEDEDLAAEEDDVAPGEEVHIPRGGLERRGQLAKKLKADHENSLVDIEAVARANRADPAQVVRRGAVKVPLADLLQKTGRHGNTVLGEPPIFKRFESGADVYPNELKRKMIPANLPDDVIRKEKLIDFDYWLLFPHEVRKWLRYSRTPLGKYDENGWWKPDFAAWKDKLQRYLVNAETEGTPEFFSAGAAMLRSIPEKYHHAWAKELPDDLKGKFRFGVQEDELEFLNAPIKLRRVLSFQYASNREIYSFRCSENAKKFGRFDEDTGRTEVILANMHRKIEALSYHMKDNHKDQQTRYGLQKLSRRRIRMMSYLKNKDAARYYKLISELGIPDIGRIRIKGRDVQMSPEPRTHHNR